ncbi:MAG: hypothetical protein FWE23_02785 [Chitinivibrionia bacterium]|nr:hypothetical protein [Chitinivibrionia bacterium]
MERSKNTNVFQRNKLKNVVLLLAMTITAATASSQFSFGGLVGTNFGIIENSYSAGKVTNTSFVGGSGGLVGRNQAGITTIAITNSFFDSEITEQSDNDGRGIPRTTAQMRQQATFIGWDFNDIWDINPNINNGMPFLRINNNEGGTFIRPRQPTDTRYGIVLENAVVSDLARISVIPPEPATVNLMILDNLGNVVFSANGVGAGFARPENRTNGDLGGQTPPLHNAIVWDLTNNAGRFVGNGTYLIIVEAIGISGRRFTYSARLGVSK